MPSRIILLGITGGSGSGKTTLSRALQRALGPEACSLLTQDSYYIDQSARFDGDGGSVNFDHPDSLDFALLAEHLRALKAGTDIEVPVYDFATHSRLARTVRLRSRPYVLLDGTLLLSQDPLLEILDETIFVDAPEAIRFERRLRRDVEERGRTPEGVQRQFERQVKPMHDLFIEPSKSKAGLVISGEIPVEDALAPALRFLRSLQSPAVT